MSVDIDLKEQTWEGVNKMSVPLEGGGRQVFSIGGGTPTLQTKTVTYTPTTSQQTDTISPDSGYDGLSLVNVIINAMQGGASNIVQGDFHTQSSAGYMNINLPYTGSGYPIVAVIVVKDGAYNPDYTHWYSTIQRYAVGQWTMSKSVMTSAPTYTTSGTQNQGVVTAIYKNSTSSSTSYTRTSGMNTNVFSSNNASNSAVNTVKFKTGNVMSVYVNTSSYGLLPQTDYSYYIIYSE